MKKDGTRNFYDTELKEMAESPSKKAMEIGRRPPYYLQANKFMDKTRELEYEQAIEELEEMKDEDTKRLLGELGKRIKRWEELD